MEAVDQEVEGGRAGAVEGAEPAALVVVGSQQVVRGDPGARKEAYGMGPARLDAYGAIFLRVVKSALLLK